MLWSLALSSIAWRAPQDVARQAAVAFRRRNFCGRHPVLMFLIAPILGVPVAYFLGLLMAPGAALLWKTLYPGIASYDMSPLQVAELRLLCTAVQVVPVAGLAALVAWLAARSGVHRGWPIAACAILGLIVAASHFDMFVSPLPQKSSITIGLGYHGWRQGLLQLARFAVPLGVGMWIFGRGVKAKPPVLAS